MFYGILLLCVILFASIMISIPIGVSLGLATAITMAFTSNIPTIMIAQNAFAALDSFPLMAIPFFILAGALMTYGGIARRLVDLAEALIGFVTGGLAIATVVACMFFSAISGSGPATLSAIGSFMIPAMKDKKYDGAYATAVTTAAATIGVIIPPSIPFVVYGVVANVSVGEMFIAGIIPGVLIGLALIITSYITSKRRGYVGSNAKFSFIRLLRSIRDAFWALLAPVIILGGIYGGVFTPTEAAAVAAVYAMFVGKYIYKELTFEKLLVSLKETAVLNGITVFTIGLSKAFGTFVTMIQLPYAVTNLITRISNNQYIVLILIIIMLLIIGCFIDNISSTIILTPILLPVVTNFGVNPIHFGIIITFALAIGFCTPPYGANLFVAAAISGFKIEDIVKSISVFLLALIISLLFIAFIPGVSMTLVNLFR